MQPSDAGKTSEPENQPHHFLTVDWCGEGKRGLFVRIVPEGESTTIIPFHKAEPYTEEEMRQILGPFEMVLYPKSVEMSFEEATEHKVLVALGEYSNQYGVVLKPSPVAG